MNQVESRLCKGHLETEMLEAMTINELFTRPKKSAQNFLLRGIEFREKLLWKLSEEDEGEQISPELIKRIFLHCIETGLITDAVRLQIKTYLGNTNVKELIEQINKVENLKNIVMNKSP